MQNKKAKMKNFRIIGYYYVNAWSKKGTLKWINLNEIYIDVVYK